MKQRTFLKIFFMLLMLILVSGCNTIRFNSATGDPCYQVSSSGEITFPILISQLDVAASFKVNVPLGKGNQRINEDKLSYTLRGEEMIINLEDDSFWASEQYSLTFNIFSIPPCNEEAPPLNFLALLFKLLPTPRPADPNTSICGLGSEVINAAYDARDTFDQLPPTDGTGKLISDMAGVNAHRLGNTNPALTNALGQEIQQNDSCGLEEVARNNPNALTNFANTTGQSCAAAQAISPTHPATLALCALNQKAQNLTNQTQLQNQMVVNPNDVNFCFRGFMVCQTNWDFEYGWYLGDALRRKSCVGFPDQFGGVSACQKILGDFSTPEITIQSAGATEPIILPDLPMP